MTIARSRLHSILSLYIAGMSCTEGSVTAASDVYNSNLQLVEMCSSEGVWSPACDYNWTLQDATVVCREVRYTSPGNKPLSFRLLTAREIFGRSTLHKSKYTFWWDIKLNAHKHSMQYGEIFEI